MTDALISARAALEEALRDGLAARGLRADLSVHVSPLRAGVVCHGRDVWAAEIGCGSAAPSAPVGAIVRPAAAEVLRVFCARLREGCDERGL